MLDNTSAAAYNIIMANDNVSVRIMYVNRGVTSVRIVPPETVFDSAKELSEVEGNRVVQIATYPSMYQDAKATAIWR